MFATRRFGKGEIVGHYYGSLVYEDIGRRSHTTKTYGERGMLGVTVAEFNKYKMRVPVTSAGLVVGEATVKTVFVVPRPFCVLRKMNDPRYLPEDEERIKLDLDEIGKRTANVIMSTTRVRSVKEVVRHDLVTMQAVRGIQIGEERFVDYGEHYFE